MRKSYIRQCIDRWLYGGVWTKILAVFVLAVVIYAILTLIFANILSGDIKDLPEQNVATMSDWWLYYYLFADPGNQMSLHYTSFWARIVAMVISTFGSICLSGLLISTITNVFERRSERYKTGFSYYKLKNHIVIIGSDQMVHGLVNQLITYTNSTIVVMTSENVEQTRHTLRADIKDKKRRDRIVVNYGVRDSELYLRAVNVMEAKEVYLLGDTSEFDDIESFHDSLNVQSLTIIAKLCKSVGRKALPCHVLFDYKTTYHVFQYADLGAEITDYVSFHPFNFYDFWARKVLVAGYSREENISYQPLDYIPITSPDSDKYVHFIIIGMSKMGQAMALQAAHIAHFPNYKKRKTKITFIDRNGKMEMNEFKQKCGELFKVSRSTYIDADAWSEAEERWLDGDEAINKNRYITHYGIDSEYEHLADSNEEYPEFIDIEWQFIKGDDHNPVVQRLLDEYAQDENAIITVAVCLNLTHISLRSAMHLPKRYYETKDKRQPSIPILVQQRKTSTMALTLNGNSLNETDRQKLLYKNIVPFGMVYDCYDLHLASSIEICKRINATYNHFFTYHTLPSRIDSAEAEEQWNKLKITKRWSNVFAALSIPTKMRSVGIGWSFRSAGHLMPLSEKQIATLAEIEHNRWNVEELLLGYRPVRKAEDEQIDSDKTKKDEYKKKFVHYDIRPFSTLKEDAKGNKANVYDEVIVRSLPLILNMYIDEDYEQN